jgi:hypothetical protein
MHTFSAWTSIFLFLFSVFACNSAKTEIAIPSGILTKDSMVSVLVDLQLLQATIDLGLISGVEKPKDKFYNIFKNHGISRSQYDSSLEFYSSHPETLSKMYVKIISELSRKQAKLAKH